MSRCIACNKVLSEMAMVATKPDGCGEDMCYRCLCYSKSEYTLWDRTYVLEGAEEGLTPPARTLD